jgi:uncharacterized membrane protein YkvA (DUF1232 family)
MTEESEREPSGTPSDAGAGSGAPLAHPLLPAYDRLRRRVLAAVERRGGRLSADAVRVLLLVPDIFLLLVRLVLDKEVPPATRTLIGSVLAYFVLPLDLLPEGLLGGAGLLDDMVLATAVLARAFGGELEAHARRHWSGPEDLRVVLREVTASAHRLLSGRTRRQLKAMLDEAKAGGRRDPG